MTYLITFACYGTWLHGDSRGSIDRHHHHPGSPYLSPSPSWERFERSLQHDPAYELDGAARRIVLEAFQKVAAFRGWPLTAARIRSKHVHLVVDLEGTAEAAFRDFKAYATRRLRQCGQEPGRTRWWARSGSAVRLPDRESVNRAVRYVVEEQGEPMAVFLHPEFRGSIPEPQVQSS